MKSRVDLIDKYNIDIGSLGDGDHKLKCPQCQPPHNPKDRPLSVTIRGDDIVFKCHHCDFAGGSGGSNKVIQMVRSSVPVEPKKPTDFVLKYFHERKISPKTINAFKIHTKDQKWIDFPYNPSPNNTADNIKSRTVDKQFRQTKNAKKSLYNYLAVKESKTVVWVEGEVDVLSCWEAGFQAVTTLPDGAPADAKFKENDKRFEPLQTHPLEKCEKLIIFVDKDQAGQNLRKELLHRFGKSICWYVETPDGCKDANDVLVKHGAAVLAKIIKDAKPYPVDGLYTAGMYKSQVADLYSGNYSKPVKIGLPGLDDIYQIQKGTFHTVTGIPNHGKSTFLDQCLVNLAKREAWRFALFSPEHSVPMHIRRLSQIVVEKHFDEGFNGRMTEDEMTEAVKWINGHFHFIETKEHAPTIDKLLEIATGAVQKYGVNGFVIDPYNEVDATRRGNYREDEHIRDFISKCKRFCRRHDVVIWIVAHPKKMQKNPGSGEYEIPSAYDISGAATWHNQSDAVLVVHRDFDTDSVRVLTRKIREQPLYGKIGEAKFAYNFKKCIFEAQEEDYDW